MLINDREHGIDTKSMHAPVYAVDVIARVHALYVCTRRSHPLQNDTVNAKVSSGSFWGVDLHWCDLESLAGLPAELGDSPWDPPGKGSDKVSLRVRIRVSLFLFGISFPIFGVLPLYTTHGSVHAYVYMVRYNTPRRESKRPFRFKSYNQPEDTLNFS